MNHRGTQKVASRQAKRTHTAATFRARPAGGLHTMYKYGTSTVQLRAGDQPDTFGRTPNRTGGLQGTIWTRHARARKSYAACREVKR